MNNPMTKTDSKSRKHPDYDGFLVDVCSTTFYVTVVRKIGRRPGIIAIYTSRAENGGLG